MLPPALIENPCTELLFDTFAAGLAFAVVLAVFTAFLIGWVGGELFRWVYTKKLA